MAAMTGEGAVLLLALALMAAVNFGTQSQTRLGAVLMAFVLTAAAMAVIHQVAQ